MRRLAIALLAVAAALAALPAGADPVGTRDLPTLAQQLAKRHLASVAGASESVTFAFGPFVIGPGSNRTVLTLDGHIPQGLLTTIEASLVDAAAGRVPLEQLAHIEHVDLYALTNRREDMTTSISDDLEAVRALIYARHEQKVAGLAWLGGTGRERTRIDLASAGPLEDLDGDGLGDRAYGIPVGGDDPNGAQRPLIAIVEVANETATPLELFVAFDATLVHGSAEQISGATGVPTFPVEGAWFGSGGDATAEQPIIESRVRLGGDRQGGDGVLVWAGVHAHPGAIEVVLTNQGPIGRCDEDVDGDGWPGLTLLRSAKIDHIPASWPYSGDYQMGATKPGWRAPVREYDDLVVYARYDVRDGTDPADVAPYDASLETRSDGDTADGRPHAWYDAGVRASFYLDRSQRKFPYPNAPDCPAAFASMAAPVLHGSDTPVMQQRIAADDFGYEPVYVPGATGSMQTRRWTALEPVCGAPGSTGNRRDACDADATVSAEGPATNSIAIAGFSFLPGDRFAETGAPVVDRSQPLTFVNLDAGLGVRHAISTCAWPCDASQLGNYPLSDGVFDTGRIGVPSGFSEGRICRSEACLRLEEGRGPLTSAIDVSELPAGPTSFFCRLHPSMRGVALLR